MTSNSKFVNISERYGEPVEFNVMDTQSIISEYREINPDASFSMMYRNGRTVLVEENQQGDIVEEVAVLVD